MRIINQPKDGALGDEIKRLFNRNADDGFNSFFAMVAYVKKSGVRLIKTDIEKFRAKGGKVRIVVGIDQKNTSYQGIELLFPLCDDIYVYHNENISHTFHPKVYAFEKEDEKAIVFVGSNNLTAGGLYINYEAVLCYEYDLNSEEDAHQFNKIKSMFGSYSNTSSECSKILTLELLQQLKEDDYLSDEEQEKKSMIPSTERTDIKQQIFGSELFRIPQISTLEETEKSAEVIQTESSALPIKGQLVWKKANLPRSDVQSTTSGTTTNPTGGLRLTRAHWKIAGKYIDWTTYFRTDLFGNFDWRKERTLPFVEATKVLFNVKILGEDKGQYRLKIRHKPSGEADQSNYTTLLSWGTLGSLIRKSNLVGKTLLLYAPPKGSKEPFFIEFE